MHDGHDSEDSSPHVDTSWRLHVSRAWAWETFLREVEDVMGIPGVSGEPSDNCLGNRSDELVQSGGRAVTCIISDATGVMTTRTRSG